MQEVLDYEALQLQPFYAGATIRFSGGWHRVADPLRHLADALGSLANPIGSPIDKVGFLKGCGYLCFSTT